MTRGVRQIVRLNWPFYAAAVAVVAVAPPIIHRLPLGAWIRMPMYAAVGLVALWLVASLAASWIVYDRSRLMQWDWVLQALGFDPGSWINIHAGLDESTPALRAIFKGARGRVFDMFDPREMTEPSIAQARRLARNQVEAEPVDFRHLPIATGTIEAALLLLSAHELRTAAARAALFTDLRPLLGPAGWLALPEY